MNTLTKILVFGGIALLVGLLLIQVVPYGRQHDNPPVTKEINWDSPETKALAQRACYDCHSNETHWPWYATVAPVSWLIYNDTIEGRDHLNFSQWGTGTEGEEVEEIVKTIRSGEMPPTPYTVMHPTAKLSPAEQEALIQGIGRTTGQPVGVTSSDGKHEDDSDDD